VQASLVRVDVGGALRVGRGIGVSVGDADEPGLGDAGGGEGASDGTAEGASEDGVADCVGSGDCVGGNKDWHAATTSVTAATIAAPAYRRQRGLRRSVAATTALG
jgi:hypothetical protein